jgi:chromosome partitioning protein
LCGTLSHVLVTKPRRATAITVINLKGGVGKTHTVWLLAGVCQERGKKLLVIDADTQANITKSLLTSGGSPFPGVEALFNPHTETDPNGLIRQTRYSQIDLLPANPLLAAYDLSDKNLWEQSDLHLSLAEGLHTIRDRYDYIIFDCPPRLSLVSFAALCASDFVVIPLEAADWGAQGIVQVTAAVDHVRAQHNSDLLLLGYLVSRFKRARAYQRSYLAKLREHFGRLAFDTIIPDLAGYEKSVTHGIPITLHAPSSIEAGIARRFFAEIQRRIHRARRGSPASGRQYVQREAVVAIA